MSETKFHISDSGKVVPCRASTHPCPKRNFDTPGEAQAFLESQYDSVPTPVSGSRRGQKALREAQKYYGGSFVTSYELALPEGVQQVIDDISAIGDPLVVGGAVRDSFEGHTNKDIDIEVHGTSIDALVSELKSHGYTVDEVGRQFGVLKVAKRGVVSDLDISVPRTENRTGAGHRSFSVDMDENMTVSEAAQRRDFTFNAVMYDPSRKMLVDPTGGRDDYEHKVMRHVSKKFAEDPLRVLRGFQFASRFNMSYAPETAELAQSLRGEYDTLSTERVQEEWGKFFTKSSHPMKGVEALKASGWDDTVPGMSEALDKPSVVTGLTALPKVIDKRKRVVFGAAVIARGMNEGQRSAFLSTTVIGVKEQTRASDLARVDSSELTNRAARKHFAYSMKSRGFTFEDYQVFTTMIEDKHGAAVAADAVEEGLASGPEADLVTGKDVISTTNRKPGPWMGQMLSELRDRQYNDEFASKEEAMVAMEKLLNKQQ